MQHLLGRRLVKGQVNFQTSIFLIYFNFCAFAHLNSWNELALLDKLNANIDIHVVEQVI